MLAVKSISGIAAELNRYPLFWGAHRDIPFTYVYTHTKFSPSLPPSLSLALWGIYHEPSSNLDFEPPPPLLPPAGAHCTPMSSSGSRNPTTGSRRPHRLRLGFQVCVCVCVCVCVHGPPATSNPQPRITRQLG
jgi:hypothetical protein